jgi:hypothetical protein
MDSILACRTGNCSQLRSQTINYVSKYIRLFVVFVFGKPIMRQPYISSPKGINSVVKEWSGKWLLPNAVSALGVFFLTGERLPSAINPPATGKTFNAYLNAAKALGPNQIPVC